MAILSTMRTSVVAALLIIGSVQAFSPAAKNNVAVYWGQRTGSLAKLCANDAVDVVLLSFMNIFPGGQDGNDLPGTNFAGNCNMAPFPGSHLLQPCAPVPEDIQTCQKAGKKVILALGGETGYQLSGAAAGEDFADKLWALAGPISANHGEPRPFGDSEVDGFDFDIEIKAPDNQDGYVAMINRLRSHFEKEDKQYYVTGAPQCLVPDANMGEMMTKAQFDMLLVQYYNTPECSARRFVDSGEGFTYDVLVKCLQGTPSENATVLLGLPAAASAANSLHYLHANEVEKLVAAHADKPSFGGIMLWDAARAEENTSEGKPYHELVKDILNRHVGDATPSRGFKPARKRPSSPSFASSETASEDVTSVLVPSEESTSPLPEVEVVPESTLAPEFIPAFLLNGPEPSISMSKPAIKSGSASPTAHVVTILNVTWPEAPVRGNATPNSTLPALNTAASRSTALSSSQPLTPLKFGARTSVSATEASTTPTAQIMEEAKKGSAMKTALTAIPGALAALALGLAYFV